TGGVVRGRVDAQARGKPREGAAEGVRRIGQLALGVERRDVGIDGKCHVRFLRVDRTRASLLGPSWEDGVASGRTASSLLPRSTPLFDRYGEGLEDDRRVSADAMPTAPGSAAGNFDPRAEGMSRSRPEKPARTRI